MVAYSANLLILAKAYRQVGKPEIGLSHLHKALAWSRERNERFMEAEILRLKGEIRYEMGASPVEVEGLYRDAIEVAGRQSAKSWLLHSTMSLHRLMQELGKPEEVQELLAEVTNWFKTNR
jgi:hypothetical protein